AAGIVWANRCPCGSRIRQLERERRNLAWQNCKLKGCLRAWLIMRAFAVDRSNAVHLQTFPPALHAIARIKRRTSLGAARTEKITAGSNLCQRTGSAAAGGRNSVLCSGIASSPAAGLGDPALRPLLTASGLDLRAPRHLAPHSHHRA